MSKNEISRTISCIYFMEIWVDLGFESSEVSLVHIHKKFEVNQTNIKGGCQSGRKVVTHNSKSQLLLST